MNPLIELSIVNNPLEATYIYSFFLISLGLFSFIMSKIHIREKISISFGVVLVGIGILFIMISKNTISLIIAQILSSLGIAMLDPAVSSIYSKISKDVSSWMFFSGMDYILEGIALIVVMFLVTFLGLQILYLPLLAVGMLIFGKIHKESL